MKEKLLHFIWRFQLFNSVSFQSTDGADIQILKRGEWNKIDSGPDFSMAQIRTENRVWAGNIEIHVKSSDWDLHKHSSDPAYENVILHVVYEHDREVDFMVTKNIPTLELKKYIPSEVLNNYAMLDEGSFNFIPCEKSLHLIKKEKLNFWLERMMIERLERKVSGIEEEYEVCGRDWEKLLFKKMAYVFGLKVNAEAFEIWADSFDYKVLSKIQANPDYVFALFFGQSGFIEFSSEDIYVQKLQHDYAFLKNKFDLESMEKTAFKFSRMRPVSFPTVRMMQLGTLYAAYQNVFGFLMGTQSVDRIRKVFDDLDYPEFWMNHFTFEKESSVQSVKKISNELIDRIIINVIVPIKFVYSKQRGTHAGEELIEWLRELPAEKNSILDGYAKLGLKPINAFESQAYLELKRHFCNEKKCLNCAIGLQIMKDV